MAYSKRQLRLHLICL